MVTPVSCGFYIIIPLFLNICKRNKRAFVCKCLQISRFRPFYSGLERQVELFLIIYSVPHCQTLKPLFLPVGFTISNFSVKINIFYKIIDKVKAQAKCMRLLLHGITSLSVSTILIIFPKSLKKFLRRTYVVLFHKLCHFTQKNVLLLRHFALLLFFSLLNVIN